MSIYRIAADQMPFSKLYRDYVSGEPKIQQFFETAFSELHKQKPVVKSGINQEKLYELFQVFNADLNLSDESKRNLESLKDSNTLTVTTGQQLGLFGGYLYTFYKTVTVIKLAQELTEAYGSKVVPVFWIADEDHDFDEANHVNFFSNDFSVQELAFTRPGLIHQQVAREILPESLLEAITTFFDKSGNSAFSETLHFWIEQSFVPGKTYKQAFLQFLAFVFADYGLIFFGSDHPEIKKATLPVLEIAVKEAGLLYNLLENQSRRVEEIYHRQAQTDTSCIFLNCVKGRLKLHLDLQTNTWSVDDYHFNSAELLEKLNENPGLLSPNVFLRPIIQEFLLPNIAYVAGPGEIAYYAQMKTFFDAFGLRMPAIIPRLSVTLVEKTFQRYWDELNIAFTEYIQRIEDLEKQWVEKHQPFDIEAHFSSWVQHVRMNAEHYKNDIVHLDASLDSSLERAVTVYTNELQKLKAKTARALKHKEEITLQRVRKVHASLYPSLTLQERKIGFVHYLNKYGLESFQQLFTKEISAIETEHILLFI